MGDHLAVGPGEAGGRGHRGEVRLRLWRAEGGAGELAVGQRDPVARHGPVHRREVVGADLVAEPARPAVDEDRHLATAQPERAGRPGVVDLVHRLDLQEVVARAKRAELVGAAVAGPRRDGGRVGAGERAALLGPLEVFGPAVAAGHRPGGALAEDGVELGAGEPPARARPDPGWHRGEERVGQARQVRSDVGRLEVAAQETDAAVDVEADPAGADHPVVQARRRHAADGEAVAPVDVGHRQRRPHDPRQGRHVGDLGERRVVAERRHQALVGVDDPVDAHPGALVARDPPAVRVEPLERERSPAADRGGRVRTVPLRRRPPRGAAPCPRHRLPPAGPLHAHRQAPQRSR